MKPSISNSSRVFPNRVREYRQKQNISGAELARRLGVTRCAVYELEKRNNRAVSPAKWLLISEILDCDLRILARPYVAPEG